MIIKQRHIFLLPSTLTIEFKDSGFLYKFEEKGFWDSKNITELFIHYTEIGNQKEYSISVNKYSKSLYISLWVISMTIYLVIGFSFFESFMKNTHYDGLIIWTPILLSFSIYRIWAKYKVVILRGNNTFITIINNSDGEKIISEIYKRRNEYYRNKIFNEMKGVVAVDTIEYLNTLGAITDEESRELKEKNKINGGNKIGLNI